MRVGGTMRIFCKTISHHSQNKSSQRFRLHDPWQELKFIRAMPDATKNIRQTVTACVSGFETVNRRLGEWTYREKAEHGAFSLHKIPNNNRSFLPTGSACTPNSTPRRAMQQSRKPGVSHSSPHGGCRRRRLDGFISGIADGHVDGIVSTSSINTESSYHHVTKSNTIGQLQPVRSQITTTLNRNFGKTFSPYKRQCGSKNTEQITCCPGARCDSDFASSFRKCARTISRILPRSRLCSGFRAKYGVEI